MELILIGDLGWTPPIKISREIWVQIEILSLDPDLSFLCSVFLAHYRNLALFCPFLTAISFAIAVLEVGHFRSKTFARDKSKLAISPC